MVPVREDLEALAVEALEHRVHEPFRGVVRIGAEVSDAKPRLGIARACHRKVPRVEALAQRVAESQVHRLPRRVGRL